ncbi:HAMP domain-containing sensor histidine kinase [uncultured Sphingomonas sp.]|uniref:sensor histidine kinase n=1 Tax=uncultured Sphingomonas sp. TaxID=158754 RepID=UPI0025D6FBAC|nr:HAMP domain-containing sensor histidine kinase [uncultured Sphingomonas sp.]
MRFDDSLKTVLAADVSTSFGASAAFRQLTDLIARGRAPAEDVLIARLRAIGEHVPVATRASVARGLALADPPAALVALFAADDAEVAASVLRVARLTPEDWDELIPRLSPMGRSVLRQRSDLPPSAGRALETMGRTDFALSDQRPATEVETSGAVAAIPVMPIVHAVADEPVVPVAEEAPVVHGERFEIADLVHRIEEFQRGRNTPYPLALADEAQVASFRFESDADGIIRWIDSAPRGAVIGTHLAHAGVARTGVDGVAAGAFRKRAAFSDARLVIAGNSPLGGDWRIAGVPVFEQSSGRFMGYRGSARRPRIDEDAARARPVPAPTLDARGAEGLRRLVHELRTPTNAIAGFSELIERELLGPVAETYRERAAAIRAQVSGLIGAIEDLDMAARIEAAALDLRADVIALQPLLTQVAEDLAPLAARRGAALLLPDASNARVAADPIAVERVISRLSATLLSASAPGETLRVRVNEGSADLLHVSIDRPAAFVGRDDLGLLHLDDQVDDADGAPLLGVGFALRLVRNLAAQLGGHLLFEPTRLTVALPRAVAARKDAASTLLP